MRFGLCKILISLLLIAIKSSLFAPGIVWADTLNFSTVSVAEIRKSLFVVFENSKRCSLGDLNLIEREMAGDPKIPLILTLENLNVEDLTSPVGVSQRQVTTSLLRESRRFKLPLPKLSAPSLLGVFICFDGEETGSCRSKPGIVYATMEKQAFTSELAYKPSDKILFFAPVVYTGKSLEIPERALAEGDDEALAQRLSKSGVIGADSQALSRYAFGLIKALQPMPAKFNSNNELVLDLPTYDFASCPKK